MEQKPKKPNDEQEVEELIEELRKKIEEQTGTSNFEIVHVDKPTMPLIRVIGTFLITLILNITLLISLSGFITWYDSGSFLYFGMFIIFFSLLEELLKVSINRFVPKKIIILSFGSISWLATIIAFIVSSLLTPNFQLIDVNATIVLFFMFMFFRSTLRNVITRHLIIKRVKRVRDARKSK